MSARFTQARKKSTKINFLGPETARWGGGLRREWVVAEKFVLSLESLSSLGFEEKNLGCPGNAAGMSRTPGGVQKVFANKKTSSCAFFVPYSKLVPDVLRPHCIENAVIPGFEHLLGTDIAANFRTWGCHGTENAKH